MTLFSSVSSSLLLLVVVVRLSSGVALPGGTTVMLVLISASLVLRISSHHGPTFSWRMKKIQMAEHEPKSIAWCTLKMRIRKNVVLMLLEDFGPVG